MDKDHRIAFRVNDGQRAFIEHDAAERGQSISDYIRTMIKRRMIEKVRGI